MVNRVNAAEGTDAGTGLAEAETEPRAAFSPVVLPHAGDERRVSALPSRSSFSAISTQTRPMPSVGDSESDVLVKPYRDSQRSDRGRQVLFMNRCYWPDAEATGQLLSQLCEYLTERWSVSVVVGQPNFHIGSSDYARSGTDLRKGVRIERLRHLKVNKGRRRYRLLNLASFTWATWRWTRRMATRPDVVVCETDPFFLPLVAAPLARRSGARLVVYLQDIYPDIAVALGVVADGLLARRLRGLLLRAYLQADRIVVLSEDMRDRLVDWGLPSNNIQVVPNWIDCDSIRPRKTDNAFRIEHGLDDRFVVMHSGNMGLTQQLDVLIDAAGRPEIPESFCLAMIGNGAKRPDLAKQAARSSAAERIRFFDYQPRAALATSLSAADLHVVSMDGRITGCLAPSKLYGILASGTPVLAIVPPGSEVWRFVESERIGWTAEPGNTTQIAERIRAAAGTDPSELAAMGQRARQLATEKYDRAICCAAFEDVLESVVSVQEGSHK